MKPPTNYGELEQALRLLDGRLTVECVDGGDFCAHLSTNTSPRRVSIEFGDTLEAAIAAAIDRDEAKRQRQERMADEALERAVRR